MDKNKSICVGITKYFQTDHLLLVKMRDTFAIEREKDVVLGVGSGHRMGSFCCGLGKEIKSVNVTQLYGFEYWGGCCP